MWDLAPPGQFRPPSKRKWQLAPGGTEDKSPVKPTKPIPEKPVQPPPPEDPPLPDGAEVDKDKKHIIFDGYRYWLFNKGYWRRNLESGVTESYSKMRYFRDPADQIRAYLDWLNM